VSVTARDLAIFLHYTYEQLAPSFGYETREATRTWDGDSPNGKLMIAVCEKLIARWRVDLPPPPPEQFQFMGSLNAGPRLLGKFAPSGKFEVCQDLEDLERFAAQSWESDTRAIARLIIVIAKSYQALGAADALAHAFKFAPEHEVYWRERDKVGTCSACNDPEHTR
jgi:hypothetical protein